MVKLSQDLRAFVECINATAVEYLIVGGFAVAFHGHPRYTGDIDFLIRPTQENAERVLAALENFGFGGIGLEVEDFMKPGSVVQLGRAPNRIDILTSITGVSFETAWSSAIESTLDGLTVRFIGRETLIENKRASGRPKDLGDVAALED